MKDINGIEIESGHKVVFSVGTSLRTGVVNVTKFMKKYGRDYEVARVTLDSPEPRELPRRYMNVGGVYQWVYNPDNLPAKSPRTTRDIFQESRIMVVG